MRLELEGFSDGLAGEIKLHDVLTIRGVASGEVTSKLDDAGLTKVGAPTQPGFKPKGAPTPPSSIRAGASSTAASSNMQFTSSSKNPIMDVEGTIQPGTKIGVHATCWGYELALVAKPPTEGEAGGATKAHGSSRREDGSQDGHQRGSAGGAP